MLLPQRKLWTFWGKLRKLNIRWYGNSLEINDAGYMKQVFRGTFYIFVLFKWVSKRWALSLPVFVHLKCSTPHLEQDNEQTGEGAKANVPEMNDRWKVIYKMNNEWERPFCLLSFPFTFSGNSFSFPSTKEELTSQVLHNSISTSPEKWCPPYTDCITALELVHSIFICWDDLLACMSCAPCTLGGQKGASDSCNWVIDSCEMPAFERWESNPGSLEEQPVLLTPMVYYIYHMYIIILNHQQAEF